MRRVAVVTVAAALALTACTSNIAAPEAVVTPQSGAPATVVIPVGVVATGEFEALDGVTTGSVVGTYDGVKIVFDFPDFVTDDSVQVMFAFADAELGPSDCFFDRYQTAFGLPTPGVPQSRPQFGPEIYSGDPSFFSTLAVLEYPTGPGVAGECVFRTMAITPIEWSLPDLRPDLDVKDSGKSAGADGKVTVDESGEPLTYVTKAGDTLPQIAERFGISADDLVYLNPCRPIVYEPTLAYANEVLNLSKERRGDRLPSDY